VANQRDVSGNPETYQTVTDRDFEKIQAQGSFRLTEVCSSVKHALMQLDVLFR
jgi:hypothetical protein